jgi:hypothetical protein
MKNRSMTKYSSVLLLGALVSTAAALPDSTNRVSVSTRYGYHIKGSFNHNASPVSTGAPRFTLDGDLYNYDDGFVLTDISGNYGGRTVYWGYDDTAVQYDGSDIALSRTTLAGDSGGVEMDRTTPLVGLELAYSYQLQKEDNVTLRFDFALGYMPLLFEEHSEFEASTTTTTDSYSLGGITPPTAETGTPYIGTYTGPGAGLIATPVGSSTSVASAGTVLGYSQLEANLWTLRIGPSLEFPICDDLGLMVKGGFSQGWLNVDARWNTQGALTSRGHGSASKSLSGGYLGASLVWRVQENWRFLTGGEFEYLHRWEGRFGDNTACIDFTRSLYLNLGVQYEF